MRNNTKLRKILSDHTITISAGPEGMEMIVFNPDTNVSFVVYGTSITQLVDKAQKEIHELKKLHLDNSGNQ